MASSSSTALFIGEVLLFFLLFPSGHAVVKHIFQFGDSLSDTGNLIRSGLGMEYNAGALPYGETYFKEPTGRFSDGRLIVDFIATFYGLSFIEPYLKEGADFTQGVDFAVAGATALDQDFFTQRNITFKSFKQPISAQLDWFSAHIKSRCGPALTPDCQKLGNESLFIFGEYGGNDYFTSLANGKSLEEVTTYIPEVVSAILDGIGEIVHVHGATKILVPGPFPFGCLAAQLTKSQGSDPADYDELGCLKSYNDLASKHYDALKAGIDKLNNPGLGIKVVLGDYQSAFLGIMKSPDSVGFDKENLLKACCGTGGKYNYDSSKLCGSSPEVKACPEPDSTLQWDGVHLTEAAYDNIATYVISNSLGGF